MNRTVASTNVFAGEFLEIAGETKAEPVIAACRLPNITRMECCPSADSV
jgi:hypothetical protein